MERTFHMLLYRAFHAERNYLRPCLEDIGLEVGQPKLLAYLSADGPCSQRRLAAYFDVDSAAVSRMLDSLERKGFITRRADEKSRRSNLVEITEKGLLAYEEWKRHCRETEEIMLQGFEGGEREKFAEYLRRAYENLQSRGAGKKAAGDSAVSKAAEEGGEAPCGI